MNPVTLAFYKAPGRFSDRVIRLATGSIYSHVEMRTPCGHWVSASRRDGRVVRVRSMYLNPDHWDVMSLPVDLTEPWRRIVPEIGKPYDTLGAILTITPILASRPEYWFCSELMAYAVGLPQPHSFTPGSLNHTLRNHNWYNSHTHFA